MAEPKATTTPVLANHEIRVLLLGLPRTTSSLITALRTLGYNPYTMRTLATTPSHIAIWESAVKTISTQQQQQQPHQQSQPQSTQSTPPLPPFIPSILSGHDSIADLPGCLLAPQLIAAYPSAKVILTTRRYPAWEADMQQSLWVLFSWRLFTLCRLTGLGQMAPLMGLLHGLFGMHNGNVYGGEEARAAFEEHNRVVREMVPKERLLEVDVDGDEGEVGWDGLCAFLEVERPKEGTPFPRFKEDKAMRRGLEAAWVSMVWYLVFMVVLQGVVVVGGLVVWLYAGELLGWGDGYVVGPLKAYMEK